MAALAIGVVLAGALWVVLNEYVTQPLSGGSDLPAAMAVASQVASALGGKVVDDGSTLEQVVEGAHVVAFDEQDLPDDTWDLAVDDDGTFIQVKVGLLQCATFTFGQDDDGERIVVAGRC